MLISRKSLLLPLLFLSATVFSQVSDGRRFRAAGILGITASQIDGDQSAGYNKLGLQGGIRTLIALKPKFNTSIEFLFSQRGAQSALVKNPEDFFFSLTLNYIEVPLQIHVYDWLTVDSDENEYYRVSFNGGFSFARLIGHKLNDELGSINSVFEPKQLVSKNDFSVLLGATYLVNRNFGFTFRWNRSLGFIYNPKKHNPAPLEEGWNGHCLYFQSFYYF